MFKTNVKKVSIEVFYYDRAMFFKKTKHKQTREKVLIKQFFKDIRMLSLHFSYLFDNLHKYKILINQLDLEGLSPPIFNVTPLRVTD